MRLLVLVPLPIERIAARFGRVTPLRGFLRLALYALQLRAEPLLALLRELTLLVTQPLHALPKTREDRRRRWRRRRRWLRRRLRLALQVAGATADAPESTDATTNAATSPCRHFRNAALTSGLLAVPERAP